MLFSKRKTIGVFISKMFKVFDEAFFAALEQESRRLDYDVVVFMTAGYYLTASDYDLQEANIFQFAPLDLFDGIIAVPSTYEQGEFRNKVYEMLEHHAKCPVAVIRQESEQFNCVYTDNVQAIRTLTKHLIEDHNLSKICIQAGMMENPEMSERLEGFRQEMAAHGLPVTENDICPGNMWINSGGEAYRAFFSDPDNIPQAVVCGNDYMAMGLIRELQKNGYRVPEDVIVTGFDNVADWCPDVPGLTTVMPDFQGMVTHAMNLLDTIIREGKKQENIVKIALPGKLILGESCGCGKRDDDFFRQLTEKSMALLEAENDQDAAMNNMSIDLGACDDLTELHHVMISKRTENPIVRDHYICLFGTAENLMEESGGKACLVHAVRDHRDCGMPMISFDRNRLLPLMAEREDEAQVFYVKLLHQKGHNFGYSVLHYDEGKVPSRCFVQTNVLLSIALENFHRRNELMALYEERRLSSITDLLTGLLNRRGLMERVEPKWRGLIGRELTFVCIDMDRLKWINDSYGHAAGDYAIRLIGQAIQESLTEEAIGARIGGDEFVVFLPDAGKREASDLVSAFEKNLERLNRKEQRSFHVSASSGFEIVCLTEKDTIEDCIQASDRILYRSKKIHHQSETGVNEG